jgi:hypothetical protein
LPRIWQGVIILYMNKENLEKIRATAERTLLILRLIEGGATLPEVINLSGAKRQLCEYYYKKLINPALPEERI